jgi:hypothetical protein
MLNVDSSGVGTSQITNQLLVRRWILKGVLCDNLQKPLSFGFQMGGRQFLGVLLGLLGKNQRPVHVTRPVS